MPTLKQLTCSIERTPSNNKLREYRTRYGDGYVESYIAVPRHSTAFNIHLTSSGYIAPGLAMWVYIDGVYQCNRFKQGIPRPGRNEDPSCVDVELRVRQKEEMQVDGKSIGRDWRFEELNVVSADSTRDVDPDVVDNVGTIEVVVLRCKEDPDQAFPPPHFANPNAATIQETEVGTDAQAGAEFADGLADFTDPLDPGPRGPTPRQRVLVPASTYSPPGRHHDRNHGRHHDHNHDRNHDYHHYRHHDRPRLPEAWPLIVRIDQTEILTEHLGPQERVHDKPFSNTYTGNRLEPEQADEETGFGAEAFQVQDLGGDTHEEAAENFSNTPGVICEIPEISQHPVAQPESPVFGSLFNGNMGLDGTWEEDRARATHHRSNRNGARNNYDDSNAGGWGVDTQENPGWSARNHRHGLAGREPVLSSRSDITSVAGSQSAHVKPYWATWNERSGIENSGANNRNVYIIPEEPLHPIPHDEARRRRVDHQVQPGPGAEYVHKKGKPEYIDSLDKPYAIFAFKYRSKAMLQRHLHIDLREQDEDETKERLQKMSKDEIIDHVLRIDTQNSREPRHTKAPKRHSHRIRHHKADRGASKQPSNADSRGSFDAEWTAKWVQSVSNAGGNSGAGHHGQSQNAGGDLGQSSWNNTPAPDASAGWDHQDDINTSGEQPWDKPQAEDTSNELSGLNDAKATGETWGATPDQNTSNDWSKPNDADATGDHSWGDTPARDTSNDLGNQNDFNASGDQAWADTPAQGTSNNFGNQNDATGVKSWDDIPAQDTSNDFGDQNDTTRGHSWGDNPAKDNSNAAGGPSWGDTPAQDTSNDWNNQSSKSSNKPSSNPNRRSNESKKSGSQSGNNQRASQTYGDSSAKTGNDWDHTTEAIDKLPSYSSRRSNQSNKLVFGNNDWDNNNPFNKPPSNSGRRSNESNKSSNKSGRRPNQSKNLGSGNNDWDNNNNNFLNKPSSNSGRRSNENKKSSNKSGRRSNQSNNSGSGINDWNNNPIDNQSFAPDRLSPIPEVKPSHSECICDLCGGPVGHTWYHCKTCVNTDICTNCIKSGKRCKNGNHNLAQWISITTFPYTQETETWIVAKGATVSSIRESMRGSSAGSAKGSNTGSQTGWVMGGGGTYQGGNANYHGQSGGRTSQGLNSGNWNADKNDANDPGGDMPGSWPAGGGDSVSQTGWIGGGGNYKGNTGTYNYNGGNNKNGGGSGGNAPGAPRDSDNQVAGKQNRPKWDADIWAWTTYGPHGEKMVWAAGEGGTGNWVPASAAPPVPWAKGRK